MIPVRTSLPSAPVGTCTVASQLPAGGVLPWVNPGGSEVVSVNLPGIGGITLKRTLVEAGRDLPTIFITALEPQDVNAALAALAPVAVLYKPFTHEALLEAIERACAGGGTEAPRT